LPLLLRIGLVLAAMLIGVAAALLLFPPRPTPDESDESDERTRLERLATERNNAASVAFQTALDTCRGFPPDSLASPKPPKRKRPPSATGKPQDSSPDHTT
jgi:hypothetical protein